MNCKIYTYTVTRNTSLDFQDKTPYLVAILEDDNGNKKSEFIHGYTDGMEIHINDPVVLEVDSNGNETHKLTK